MSTANRVIKNTGFLYAKMGITMFISLYTTRLILNALGAGDFGIFNIVGGAIAMLGFLNAAMAGATQRFMSYTEGEGNKEKQKSIFNISVILHLAIALLMAVLLAFVGYFFFHGILNIAPERIYAAKVVYASLIVSTVFTVMTVPYDAVLNAHENMLYYSIVGIIESALKLAVAFLVVLYGGDKLVLYGILMAVIPLITMTIMRVYCHRKYVECVIQPRHYWNKVLMKEMTGFAGWSFVGTTSAIISQYGLSIVLNHFWGSLLNAAQGIANQISGQLMTFSSNMLKALSPLVIKSEGSGNRELMLKVSLFGCKFSFYILSFFAIPFIIEAPFILGFWLGDVPEWAILFTRLQLLRSLTEQLTTPLGSSISAHGDIKGITLFSSILNLQPIILTALLFYFRFPPYYMYIVWIFTGSFMGGFLLLNFLNNKCQLDYQVFLKEVLYFCLINSIPMLIIGIIPIFIITPSFYRLFLVVILTSAISIFVLWNYLLSNDEKLIMKNLIKITKNKLLKIKNQHICY